MSKGNFEAELGELIESHRPCSRWIGWLVPLVVAVPAGLFCAFGPPGPFVGLVFFLLLGSTLFFMFAESCFLEHRLYEHGLVFRSFPGYPVMVIPHSTIDPDSFDIGGRKIPDGLKEMHETSMDRGIIMSPCARHSIRFDGLHSKRARRIGNGKLNWHDATTGTKPDGSPEPTPTTGLWWVGYRDAAHHSTLIQQTVLRSQQTRPYHGQDG